MSFVVAEPPSPNYSYPDHYTMKIVREKALKENAYRCSLCGKEAIMVHHKDLSKDNHAPENLMPVCAKCHAGLHKKSKIVWDPGMIEVALMHRGMDKGELASSVDITRATLSNILRTGNTKNSTMSKIADALNYPIEVFITDEKELKKWRKLKAANHENVLTGNNLLKHEVDKRIKEIAETEKHKSMYKNWLPRFIREYFNVDSYYNAPTEKAIQLIRQWEPGKPIEEYKQPA